MLSSNPKAGWGFAHLGLGSPGPLGFLFGKRAASILIVAAVLWLAPHAPALSKDVDISNSGWVAITISRDIHDYPEFKIKSADGEKTFGTYKIGGTWFSKYSPDFESDGPVSKLAINETNKIAFADVGDKFDQKVFIVNLPAGNYNICQFIITRPEGNVSPSASMNDIAFSIAPGRVTYLGQYELFPVLKGTWFKNIYIVGGWKLSVSNQRERDNPLILARTGLPNPAGTPSSQPIPATGAASAR